MSTVVDLVHSSTSAGPRLVHHLGQFPSATRRPRGQRLGQPRQLWPFYKRAPEVFYNQPTDHSAIKDYVFFFGKHSFFGLDPKYAFTYL